MMTIPYKFIFDHELSPIEKERIKEVSSAIFNEINLIYNNWNPGSEVSKLNRAPADQKIEISSQLFQFLKKTNEIYHLTHGLFDPTIAPLLKIWKEHLKQGILPTESILQEISPAIGWNKIHFEENYFWKDHHLTALDLCGIAKGYCIDLLVESFIKSGFTNIFVEWGGEIKTFGRHPDKRPWVIEIKSINNVKAGIYVEMNDLAIATSGDYYQFWKVETPQGIKIFSHLINPRTFMAQQVKEKSIGSASICASSCMLADGLATASMLLETQQAAQIWLEEVKESIPRTNFWLQTRTSVTLKD